MSSLLRLDASVIAGHRNDLALHALPSDLFKRLRRLVARIEARDPFMAGHSERVSGYAVAIGRAIGLGRVELERLRIGALLHDVGKVAISRTLLTKTGHLTPEEVATIRLHPRIGALILDPLPFFAAYLPIVELHHERPDGTGYPYGLGGDDIPLPARVVHVADAFDAITSARAYRSSRPVPDAICELRANGGSQFDRLVIEALIDALAAGPELVSPPPAGAPAGGPARRSTPSGAGTGSRSRARRTSS